MIVKTASDWPFKNERDILEAFRDRPCIRPIVDTTDDPPSLILRYLDDNLLKASNAKALERTDIKYVARKVLQALEALHSHGYVHTGNAQESGETVTTSLIRLQTSSPITFSLIMVPDRIASAKYSLAIVEMLSRSTSMRVLLTRVMSLEQRYSAAQRQR